MSILVTFLRQIFLLHLAFMTCRLQILFLGPKSVSSKKPLTNKFMTFNLSSLSDSAKVTRSYQGHIRPTGADLI
jgi:hypothetical protein